MSGEGGGHCNEWEQTSNPAVETTITGFKVVSLAFKEASSAMPWVGLGRDKSAWTYSLIDDSPSISGYRSSIGATEYHLGDETITGPWKHLVTNVELYVFNEGTSSTTATSTTAMPNANNNINNYDAKNNN